MKTAYSSLGPNAQKAITAARSQEFNEADYKFGDFIESYSLAADPLERNCLESIEIFRGTGCTGNQINEANWNNIVTNLNLIS